MKPLPASNNREFIPPSPSGQMRASNESSAKWKTWRSTEGPGGCPPLSFCSSLEGRATATQGARGWEPASCSLRSLDEKTGNQLLRGDTLLLNQLTEEGKGAVKAFAGCDGSCEDHSVKYFMARVPQPLISTVRVPHRRHYQTQFLFRSEMAPLKPSKWEKKQSALKLSQFAFQTTRLPASQPFRF